MKRILTVYTGGTICTAATGECRQLSPALAKRALMARFAKSESRYAAICEELFCDSGLPKGKMTLSENMTLDRLWYIAQHIREKMSEEYCGIIVMHGTDTLAYSAAFLSMLFADSPIPIMLVSGNRPPMDERSNATENLRAAVELIMEGIAPNVYVPYKNSDGIVYLHLGSRIMQCAGFDDDFFSAGQCLAIGDKELLGKCEELSAKRVPIPTPKRLSGKVLLLRPYTGLEYSNIMLDNVSAVLHGAYHSGTVCAIDDNSESSVLYLAKRCAERDIPLFVAPCKLDEEQYSSAYDMVKESGIRVLYMTEEAAYAKLILGAALRLEGKELKEYMDVKTNNEFIEST